MGRAAGPRPQRRRRLLLLAGLVFMAPAGLSAQERPFPYTLGSGDWVAASVGLASTALGYYLRDDVSPLSVQEIESLHRRTVNAFDRGATHNWSTGWHDVSDWTRNGIVLASGLVPFLPLALDDRWSDVFTLGVIFGEAAAITAGVTNITKVLAQRTRPYVYNDELSPEFRAAVAGGTGKASFSFFSGHTSVSFGAATLLSTVYSDLHGSTTTAKIVWASSLSAAALVSYARVEAGMHFPTDVLMGAAVGAAIGHLVPRLHRTEGSPVRIVTTPGYLGVQWQH